MSRESGSVVLLCVAFERFSPLKSTIPVPSPPSFGGSPSLRLKLLNEAQASISVPSTVKWSEDNSCCRRARHTTSSKKRRAMSVTTKRSRNRLKFD